MQSMQLEWSLFEETYESDAIFDETRTYRYSLKRTWNPKLRQMTFIMLNPSTADHQNDDPTIRRCIGFAKQWGFGCLEVVNLFAFRATDPFELLKCQDPIGDQNDLYIEEAQERSSYILLAWGTKGSFMDRDRQVIEILKRKSDNVYCLSRTKEGFPKHPLYIRNDVRPIPFF